MRDRNNIILEYVMHAIIYALKQCRVSQLVSHMGQHTERALALA